MYRTLLQCLTFCVCAITVAAAFCAEVELLLVDLIQTNNMSRVLYISHHPPTENLFLRNIDFLMIQDVSCRNPNILEHSGSYFLAVDDSLTMNVIIDCDSDRVVENILVKILQLEYNKNRSMLFLLPMFNVIIISKELPDFYEQSLLNPTKDMMVALVFIIHPEVLLAPDIAPTGAFCDAYLVYRYHPHIHTDNSPAQFTKMAILNKDCSIEGRTDILLHSFTGFMGRLVNVGIIVNPLFLFMETSDNGEVTYSGLFKDFLDLLSKELNFTYNIIPTVDGLYGVQNEAGDWSGLTGMLQRKEIDLVMTGLTITAARAADFDFTVPFWEEHVIAVYHGDGADVDWFSLFRPFKYQVWLGLLTSILVASYVMWALQFCDFHKSEKASSSNACLSLRESSWNLLGGILVQAAVFLPPTMPSKSVFISFFLTAVLVGAFYNGNLKATTVSPDRTPRYPSFSRLTADKELTIHVNKGGANRNILENSHKGILGSIWQIIQSREDSLTDSTGEAVYRMMQDPSHVAIGDKSDVIGFLMRNDTSYKCKRAMIPEPLFTSQYALALPQGSPYKSAIDNVISKLVEMGFMKKWFQQAIPSISCHIDDNAIKPVGINQMRAMLVLLGTGVVLGTLAAITESCYYRKKPTGSVFLWRIKK